MFYLKTKNALSKERLTDFSHVQTSCLGWDTNRGMDRTWYCINWDLRALYQLENTNEKLLSPVNDERKDRGPG